MELRQVNVDDVTLMAPLQSDGNFPESETEFWEEAKQSYKIFLLRDNYIFEDREHGEDLFYVWTGVIYCIFRGKYKR